MKSSSRNFGIDILRIVSMLGVVLLHVLNHGGVLGLDHSPASFSVVWFLEVLAFPAVNCFVLISGYVGYKAENIYPKIRNIISLLFTVLFYSISIFLVFKFFGAEPLGLVDLVKSFMPTILKSYWFFSAYLGVFLLSPLLNLFVYKSNFKQVFVFLVIFSLFSVVSTFYDTFSVLEGYSVIWFAFMYLIGAIIKKYNLTELFCKRCWVIIALAAFIITWLSKIVLDFTNIPLLEKASDTLVKYVSPTIVIMAVVVLSLFSKINCPPSFAPIISFFATSAFSVYLIHDNELVRQYLISEIHNYVGDFNIVLLILSIICCVCAIFITCILIDKIRIFIFKVIKLDKLAQLVEKLIKKILNATYKKLEKI